jgi:hypothetical protein
MKLQRRQAVLVSDTFASPASRPAWDLIPANEAAIASSGCAGTRLHIKHSLSSMTFSQQAQPLHATSCLSFFNLPIRMSASWTKRMHAVIILVRVDFYRQYE